MINDSAIKAHEDYPLPPRIAGIPFLGHGLKMRGHVGKFFADLYQEHGEIIRIPILNRDYTLMAGLDVNRWFVKNQDLFGNYDIYALQAEAWNAPFFITASDGNDHKMLRRAVRPAQSTSAYENRLDEMIALTETEVQSWEVGSSFSVWRMLQLLITDQIGMVATNHKPGDYFDDFRRFFIWTTNIDVSKTFPRWCRHLPQFRNTVTRLEGFASELLASHREDRNGPQNGTRFRDIVDDLLDEQDQNPDIWLEEILVASIMGPFIAGMDTVASTMSFLFYLILKHPEVYEMIQAEIDSAYADNSPLTREKLESMRTLNGAVHETLRLYPIGAATPRMALEDFTYNGYRVDKGSIVYIVNSVPHFLEEYYPNPYAFDPQRPLKPPAPLVFTPFSLGSHTCLGAGFAQLQILTTAVVILRHARLQLDPRDYELKPQAAPVPNTGYELKVKIVSKA